MTHACSPGPRVPPPQQLNLDGCRLLTERSLHYLGKHCRDLKTVSTIARLPVEAGHHLRPGVTVSIGALALPGAVGGSSAIFQLQVEAVVVKIGGNVVCAAPTTFRALSATVATGLTVFEMRADLLAVHVQHSRVSCWLVDAERTENPQLEIMRMIDAVRGAVFEAPLLLVATVDNMKEHLEKEHLNSCYDKDFPHQWRYVQSIQCAMYSRLHSAEVKVDSNVQAQVQYWAEHDYLRSLSALSPVVVTTMKCVMLIFDIPFTEDDAWPTAKNLVSETRFLLRFKDTNTLRSLFLGRHAKLLADLDRPCSRVETGGIKLSTACGSTCTVIKYCLVKEHERELNPAGAAWLSSQGNSKRRVESSGVAFHVTQHGQNSAGRCRETLSPRRRVGL
uniref:FSA_C domain-containing protein n=1 Tax=Macrostomum lignano TaxID=282301 RepID=A0A1I8FPG5_9PLAT